MPATLLGRKIGMTRYYTEDGTNVPVTVIEAGPCAVTQIKTSDADGYSAVQIGFGEIKPRRSTMPLIGHNNKAGVDATRFHREIRLTDDSEAQSYELGQKLNVSTFEDIKFVDITGVSKGKGFQGVMKRHGFRGQEASHGVQRKHRQGGGVGGGTNLGTGPKVRKGKRMAGQMGNVNVTVRSIDIISIDPERNLLLVKGPVPGPIRGLLYIQEAKRLYKPKARITKGK